MKQDKPTNKLSKLPNTKKGNSIFDVYCIDDQPALTSEAFFTFLAQVMEIYLKHPVLLKTLCTLTV